MARSSEDNKRVWKGIIELLGLPDEAYQSLTVHLDINDVIRVEAKFIAKGKEWNGEVLDSGYETTTLDGSDHGNLMKLKD